MTDHIRNGDKINSLVGIAANQSPTDGVSVDCRDIQTQRQLKFSASIQDRFEQFHRDNPRVYQLLVRFALEAKRLGRQKYSIDAIYHRVRWYVHIETNDPDFKLNNDFTSRYARKIMDEVQELSDFFETRVLKS